MLKFIIVLLSFYLLVIIKSQEIGESCIRNFDFSSGRCLPYAQCQKVKDEASSFGITPQRCRSAQRTNRLIVCCPEDIVVNKRTEGEKRISVKKCEEYSRRTVELIPFIPLLFDPPVYTFNSSHCDYSIPLIIGGEEAAIGEFPHMAAIGWTDAVDGSVDWKCGGSVISERFILTAAHCVAIGRFPPDIVRLGDHNLYSDSDRLYPENFQINKIIIHPEYKYPARYNDIALLQLSGTIVFRKYIRPACLWQSHHINYTTTVATGWGLIDFAADRSDTLLKVAFNVIELDVCRQFFENSIRGLKEGLIDSQICAGDLKGGKDTCQGDSGGPIQVTTKSNECIFHIIGVTSFGRFCGAQNSPGVYTRVSSYIDWIEFVVWP